MRSMPKSKLCCSVLLNIMLSPYATPLLASSTNLRSIQTSFSFPVPENHGADHRCYYLYPSEISKQMQYPKPNPKPNPKPKTKRQPSPAQPSPVQSRPVQIFGSKTTRARKSVVRASCVVRCVVGARDSISVDKNKPQKQVMCCTI